mmetsp:Transcript_13163/g.52527  ORF Transcript_13163/g.52527 Transcript_13163/m.52527 type:complete len:488 (+) Transcript_13163:56-1519(+)
MAASRSILAVLVLLAFVGAASATLRQYRDYRPEPSLESLDENLTDAHLFTDPGEPLYLSQYLPNNTAEAKSLSQVGEIGWDFPSYSGYFTVGDPSTNSNMFFWYFPAQNGNPDAPLLLWLQGGPGSASMFGLFNENGPFYVATPAFPLLVPNNHTWNHEFSMIFIDNPVGAGWSFTDSTDGFCTDEVCVADNLYETLMQFFEVFPECADVDFYITGESYAGKYIPSLATKIHHMNTDSSNPKVNLVGLSIGDGTMDPPKQIPGFAEMWYQVSVCDDNQRQVGKAYEDRILAYLAEEQYTDAFYVYDEYLNGDFWEYGTFYYNISGLDNYFNFDTPVYPNNPYVQFLNLPSTRAAIHTGWNKYTDGNSTTESYMINDILQSVGETLPTLMDNYKVLMYNGQNDIILSAPQAQNFYRSIPWKGQDAFLTSERQIWKVHPDDYQVAGYVRQAQTYTQIVVRDAGHLVPSDQPERALDMITRFVKDLPWTD